MYFHMRSGKFTLLLAGIISLSAAAQEFNIQPAGNTRRALNRDPGVDHNILDGFYPSLSVSLSRQGDALRKDGIRDSDTVYRISPGIGYKTRFGSANSFQARYSASFEKFDQFKELNSTTQALDAAVTLSPTEKLDFDIYAGYVKGEEERGGSATRLMAVGMEEDKYDNTSLGGRVTFGRRSSTLQLRGGLETSKIDYTNNGQNIRDRDIDTISAGVYYNIRPKTSLNVSAEQADTNYISRASNRDSRTTSYMAGVNWDPTYATSLNLSVGKQKKDMDDPALQDFDGTAYRGRVSWNPKDRTRIGLYASRTSEESPEIVSSYFVSRVVGASVSQQLSSRLGLSLFANNIEDDFSNGRKDDTDDYSVTLSYAATKWLQAGLRYGKTSRNSNNPEAVYDDDIISLLFGFNWAKNWSGE